MLLTFTMFTAKIIVSKPLFNEVLYTNIDQTPLKALHDLLNCSKVD